MLHTIYTLTSLGNCWKGSPGDDRPPITEHIKAFALSLRQNDAAIILFLFFIILILIFKLFWDDSGSRRGRIFTMEELLLLLFGQIAED